MSVLLHCRNIRGSACNGNSPKPKTLEHAHQVGVQEMLLVSELRGRCPSEIHLLGVIPASLSPGTELSPLLQRRVGELASQLVAELRETGLAVQSVTPS